MLLDLALLGGAALVLGFGIERAALWDPLELELAERGLHPARGDAAAHVLHATFGLFGESAATARLAGLAATLVGVLALWGAVTALESRAAARFVPLVLVTTPSLFVHARTALPDALATGAMATTFGGLAVFALDAARPLRARAPALVLGALGAAAGWYLAGPVLGTAVPVGSVALAAATRGRARSDVAVALALGLVTVLALVRGAPTGPSHGAPFAVATSVLHAAFPWSALLPLALATVRERPLASATWTFVATTFAAVGWLASHEGPVIEAAPLPVALLAALALTRPRSDDRTSEATRWAIGASAVLAILLAVDFDRLPEKAAIAWTSGHPDRAPQLPRSAQDRSAFALAAALLGGAALAACFVREGRRRALALGAGALAGALVLRVRFHPAVASAAGPGEAFAAWHRLHQGEEALGALGVSAGTLRFARAGTVVTHDGAPAAHAWLDAPGERRFLVAPATELPALNAQHRARHHANLPVVSDATAAVLLLSNRADDGAQSPLDAFVRSDVPAHAAPVNARFGDALELAGWEVVDERGAPRRLSTHTEAHLRLYWRVLRAPTGHCTFLHVDRSPARFAAEHGSFTDYPTSLWQPGDVVVDDYVVRLPLAFRGAVAPAYVGVGVLPCNDDRRMPVTVGSSDGHDRLLLGRLAVE
jgi:hypothetical protein